MKNNFCNSQGIKLSYGKYSTLISWISEVSLSNPNKIAIIEDDYHITYEELESLSDSVAAHLIALHGNKRVKAVGIADENTIERLISILGVLKAGGAYVPLDVSYPKERIKYIIDTAGVDVVICHQDYSDRFDAVSKKLVVISELIRLAKKNKKPKPNINIRTLDPVHILFTSGSTGNPKGVIGSNRSIINRFTWTLHEFPVSEDDVLCHKTSLNFIPSVWEAFGPLVSGCTLVLIKSNDVKDARKFTQILDNNKVNRIILIPSLLENVMEEVCRSGIKLNELTLWMTSGERLSGRLAAKFYSLFPNAELVNIYGSTEIEDGCFFRVNSAEELSFIPIGTPIANSKVIVLKENGNIAKFNEAGEICFSGPGVAQGYIGKFDIRDKQFTYKESNSEETYFKTGDYGRILKSGAIEYLGRKDNQVKVRGQRAELEEIELVLNSLSEVKKAAVIFDPDNEVLFCYFVASKNEKIYPNSLKEKLRKKLPEYMVPVRYVQLEALPLTPNGKLDRISLDIPNLYERSLESKLIPPKNNTEQEIVEIFEELLSIREVGVADGFFELGGDSLKASQALIKLKEKLGSYVSFNQFYKDPTPLALSEIILNACGPNEKKDIQRLVTPDTKEIKLSPIQKRILMQQELMNGSDSIFNLMSVFEISGEYGESVIRDSIIALLERHHLLLMKLEHVDGKAIFSRSDNTVLKDKTHDFNEINDLLAYADECNSIPINTDVNLTELCLARVTENKKFYILFKVHHLIFDGWSLEVLSKDLSKIIRAKSLCREPRLDKSFSSYNSITDTYESLLNDNKSVKFWKEYLSGYSGILNFPTDYRRSTDNEKKPAKRLKHLLHEEQNRAITKLANELGVTPYTIYLAAYCILLFRYTDQNDVVVGIPVSTRNFSQLNDAIGFFVNIIPLRIDRKALDNMESVVNHISDNMISVEENKFLPFDRIASEAEVTREWGYHPIYQSMFTYQAFQASRKIDNKNSIRWFEIGSDTVEVDMSLIIQPMHDGQREVVIEYDASLFKEGTIVRFLDSYKRVMDSMLKDLNQNISGVDYISESDRNKLIKTLNHTNTQYPAKASLSELFEQTLMNHSTRLAVEFEGLKLNYSDLDRQVDQLAKKLLSIGVGHQDYVAVTMERSEKLIISMLAIWRIGAIYLPISPDLPLDRIQYIVKDTNAEFALIDDVSSHLYKDFSLKLISVDSFDKHTNHEKKCKLKKDKINETDIAYVMYTSGSTGTPKGVLISHRSIVDRVFCLIDFYRYNCTSRHLQYGSYSFDTSLEELLLPIFSGGTLVFAPRQFNYDPKEFVELIKKYSITSINFIPSLHRVFLDYVELNNSQDLDSLKYVISGAETLTPKIVKKFYQLFPNKVLFNSYGPTENTINSTLHICTKEDGESYSVPIGKCIANSSCYVLDQNKQIVPFGVPGELYVGGIGLALGYLNRTDLTNEKFVKNPFTDNEEKIYATGDLVKMFEDGTIEFIGRNDSQLKIRGFRIELGEVEAAIRNLEDVSYAVVLSKLDSGSEAYLVAYIKPNSHNSFQLDAEKIKHLLKDIIPEYMIPRIIVILDDFPLLASGKIDVKALSSQANYEKLSHQEIKHPISPVEQEIYELWKKLLSINEISVDQNFFSLGGSSILIIQMLNELRKNYQVDISLRDIYKNPTIKEIASLVEKADKSGLPDLNINHVREKKMPLSFSQERLWFLDQFNNGSIENVIPLIFKLEGELDIQRFRHACEALCLSNEALLLNFGQTDGMPYQTKSQHGQFDFEVINAKNYQTVIESELKKPFNLKHDPLIRFRIIHQDNDVNVLLMSMHHIISDGWSCSLILKELSKLYNHSNQSVNNKSFDFLDYVYSEKKSTRNDISPYWRGKYSNKLPLLQLPIDKSRPAKQTFNGDSVQIKIEGKVLNSINDIARKNNLSLFTYLLSAYFVLLNAYTRQDDLIVGTVFANRNNKKYEDVIGYFVNTLPLRLNINNNDTFYKILLKVSKELEELSVHQNTPFERLVEEFVHDRDMSRSPIFQTLFVMQDTLDDSIQIEGIKASQEQAPHYTSKFDMSVLVSTIDKELVFTFEYNTDLFNKDTITRIAANFASFLSLSSKCPNKNLNEYEYMGSSEKLLLESFNKTEYCFNKSDFLLDELSNENFINKNNKVALVTDNRSLTYDEINTISNKLANYLVSRKIKRGSLVAIVMEKGWEQIIAAYAILKSGAAYLPINAHDPINRINELLVSGKCEFLLTQDVFRRKLDNLSSCECISVDSEHLYKDCSDDMPKINRKKDDLAYVIFTSGSTGKPKGVMIKHESVVNTILDINDRFNIGAGDVIYGISSLNFDLSVYDIFGTFAAGGTLVLPSENDKKNPEKWLSDIQGNKITFWNSVPALMQMLCDYISLNKSPNSLGCLKNILLSGDWIPLDLPVKIRDHIGAQASLTSLGGATEASIWSIAYDVSSINREWKSIPYGKPLRNQSFYVLNESGMQLPIGVAGELYIGGAGVASGYWDDFERTNASFIKLPTTGEVIYKTGDLGRYLPDGNIEFLGRNDHQVKIRGYRVELGEIQSKITERVDIDKAIVIDYKDNDNNTYLVAYIVSVDNVKIEKNVIRSELKSKLPEYMVPSYFIQLVSLPLTENGKIDRKSLPLPSSVNPPVSFEEKTTETESKIKEIWSQLLNINNISRYSSFFEVGGHSLLATKAAFLMRKVFSVNVPITLLFENPILSDLASSIEMLRDYLYESVDEFSDALEEGEI
ncbi:MAG: amino acid adenylation domain-containing protein [Legionellales bacterium]|nr:amino acid adenylation domain-containing protein [Legionellales bacterium]